MAENKVKFGLKKCYYSVITDTAGVYSYAAPVAMPGAVSLTAAKTGDSTIYEADDSDFWVVASQQYDITLELSKLPESFYTAVLGFESDAKTIVWEKGAESKRVALLFESSGDQNNPRYAFMNCMPTPPDVEAETSKARAPKNTTLKLVASADPDGRTLAQSISTTDATTYSAWFSAVPSFTAT